MTECLLVPHQSKHTPCILASGLYYSPIIKTSNLCSAFIFKLSISLFSFFHTAFSATLTSYFSAYFCSIVLAFFSLALIFVMSCSLSHFPSFPLSVTITCSCSYKPMTRYKTIFSKIGIIFFGPQKYRQV